ncbi:unnamed protein product [Rotaria socialis]|uniref:Uncharacterized protein n=1 Tax=Rotaria socialis TaxID=392032 RepID=A0A821T601_9BILA|nr:unnamed protein product [Rotaria socialis]CAF3705329.1 unnamed protein product [Rotaria socialis]CAF4522681.1 unnamed protein product [Rotaria socialis]CAF4866218.1 unnamed protein product [Rotaria socialis]
MTTDHSTSVGYNKSPTPEYIVTLVDTEIAKPSEYEHLNKAFSTNTDSDQALVVMLIDKRLDNLIVMDTGNSVLLKDVPCLRRVFNDENDCLEAFERYKTKRIFFVTSAKMGQTLVPIILTRYHQQFTDPMTHASYRHIYIYCPNLASHLDWDIEFVNYVHLFDCHADLLRRLTHDIAEYFLGQSRLDLINNDPKEIIDTEAIRNTNKLIEETEVMMENDPEYIENDKEHHDHGDGGQLRTFQLPSNQSLASSDPVLFSDNVDLSSFMDDIIVMIEVNSCFNTNELEDSVDRLESDQPFLIVSQKPPCVHLLQRRGFMSYFWLQPADKFVGFQFPLSEGVIEIDTTEDLIKELYHELAQYYRKEALRVRKQEAGAVKAKDLLAKSTQCYKILEKGSAKALEQYKALLMQSNTNINKAMGTSSELS